MKEFAKILGPQSSSRRRCSWEQRADVFGYPNGGSAACGVKAPPNELVVLVKTKEWTPLRGGFSQKIERSFDVGFDEILPVVCDDVWLMQAGRMEHRVDSLHAPLHISAVRDRPHPAGKR